MSTNKNAIFTIRQIAIVGLMAAVICVLAPHALPISISPVPISLGTLGVYFVISVLGMKLGTMSVVIYLLVGMIGAPVFAKFASGVGVIAGPTGGYLIGYIPMALICGFFVDRFSKNIPMYVLGMVLGTLSCYLLGTVWLAISQNLTFFKALNAGVIPYIPGDIAKLIIATSIGYQIRRALKKAGLI